MSGPATFRKASTADLSALRGMHRASLFTLGRPAYEQEAIRIFLDEIVTADPDLVADGTYHVAEVDGILAASGGWTMRRPTYEARLGSSAPEGSVATIRGVFTAPAFAGLGLARRIMERAESEAVVTGGAERIQLCATRSAVGFYARLGYAEGERGDLVLGNGVRFGFQRMSKDVAVGFPSCTASLQPDACTRIQTAITQLAPG